MSKKLLFMLSECVGDEPGNTVKSKSNDELEKIYYEFVQNIRMRYLKNE